MIDRRIQYDKDKEVILSELCSTDSHKHVFSSMADCLCFAASYGYNSQTRLKLNQPAPNPIRYSVFENAGYDTFVHLLAMKSERDAHALANDDKTVELRATIFEEYANGGLELLKGELKESFEGLEPILLILTRELSRARGESIDDGKFDLSSLEI